MYAEMSYIEFEINFWANQSWYHCELAITVSGMISSR
jgi:hypothetical protein